MSSIISDFLNIQTNLKKRDKMLASEAEFRKKKGTQVIFDIILYHDSISKFIKFHSEIITL